MILYKTQSAVTLQKEFRYFDTTCVRGTPNNLQQKKNITIENKIIVHKFVSVRVFVGFSLANKG